MVSKGAEAWVVWPTYFDLDRSVIQGRRVPKAHCMKRPTLARIADAAQAAGITFEKEDAVRHPSMSHQPMGRLLVPRIQGAKTQVLRRIGQALATSE